MPRPRPSSQESSARLLADGIEALRLELPEQAPAQLLRYLAELQKWNAAYNLTAIRDPGEMVTRHLLDSLAVLPVLDRLAEPAPLLDVGSGAGLPGLVLAIARPQWPVTTLDSNGKKARFMRHAVRVLGLGNAQVVEARVEDHAARYGSLISRAYARLGDFVSGTRHLRRPGGHWVAMKGKLDPLELAGLPPDCSIRETHRLTVPGLHEERHAVILISGSP